ncbi:MAG: lysophospholipid acyltransferase family protein [Phycisphaerae bacterium]|nr:lysophospholipid acyltransferase family protein [Phycisphaerae bacterium]
MRPRNTIVDWLVYAGVRIYCMISLMFPIDINLRTGRWLGWIWYKLMARHRNRAEEHLRFAFGDSLSRRERDRLVRKSMQQMTMMAIEVLQTPRIISEWTWPRHVQLKNLSEAVEVLLDRRGAILLTGHYGNWELLGFALAALGFKMTAVMRPLDNAYLNDYLMDQRQARGLDLLYKKGATQSAEDILEDGGLLCFIADQNAGSKGLFVDFFGRQASTYKSIGLLAIRHEVPIIVGYARRLSPQFEYEIGVNRIIRPHEWQGRDDELLWITQEYTRAIEAFVREAPEQYLWIHRRWKSRPPAERVAAAVATAAT